jgi:Arc/MetJ family transcription regulator
MNTISSAELADTLNHLRLALNGLNIDDAARRAVKEDLDRLEMATRKKQPDKDEVGGILKTIQTTS